MITTADLKAQTRRELCDLARNYNIPGWHALRKEELIGEIQKVQRRLRRKAASKPKSTSTKQPNPPNLRVVKNGSPSKSQNSKPNRSSASVSRKNGAKTKSNSMGTSGTFAEDPRSKSRPTAAALKAMAAKPSRPPQSLANTSRPIPKLPEPKVSAKTARIRAQLRKRRETTEKNKDLSTGTLVAGAAVQSGSTRARASELHQDRAILLVRGPFWLQANWEITRSSVERAQAALAENWNHATPMLRLLSVGDVTSNSAESVERDIPIHGGVDNWYIDVDDPPRRYRVLIGYATGEENFYTVCRSNVVETPMPGDCERLDEHWRDIAEDYERIYSLSGGYDTDDGDLREIFEERLHRSMPLRGDQGQTVTDPTLLRQSKLPFFVDAELIVFGKTIASASVQVAGKPVKLQADGSFTVRVGLPDKRQVLPVTAESRDGLRQRTTVVAVERNTKVMETVDLDERNA